MTALAACEPQLSCYTTNLVAYLEATDPGIRRRFGHAVRLAVRTDLPAGHAAFSHHERVDAGPDGRGLGYRGAPDWERARAGLLAELEAEGQVLVAGNTRYLPWSPAAGQADAPHWLLLRGRKGDRWLLADQFAALTPYGEQEPFLGWVGEEELARALTPVPEPPAEVAARDGLALGLAVPVPPAGQYRWLRRTADPGDPQAGPGRPGPGEWLLGDGPVVAHLLGVLTADTTAPARYADDLWAASCHYAHRNSVLAAEGRVDPARAAAATVAWAELPKVLRFAAESARRGRPRNGVIERAFTQLLDVTEALGADPVLKG